MRQIEFKPQSLENKRQSKLPKLSLQAKVSLLLPLVAIVFVLIVGSLGYFLYQETQLAKGNELTAGQDERELAEILKAMSRTVELPDEKPTMATVTDKSKLQDQPFFNKAENGDKVLFFTDAAKAILYRPDTKKIIDFTTIRITDQNTTASPSPSQQEAENAQSQ